MIYSESNQKFWTILEKAYELLNTDALPSSMTREAVKPSDNTPMTMYGGKMEFYPDQKTPFLLNN